MNKFLNKHRVIVLLIAVISFLFLSNKVFAVEDIDYSKDFTITNNTGNGSETYNIKGIQSSQQAIAMKNGFIVVKNNDYLTFLVISKSYDTYFYLNEGGSTIGINEIAGRFKYSLSTEEWIVFGSTQYEEVYSVSNFVNYSADIYTNVNKTDYFFQLAPVEEVKKVETALLEVVKSEEMKKTLGEVIVMFPLILSVLVSLIALRKGLIKLLNFLKKS